MVVFAVRCARPALRFRARALRSIWRPAIFARPVAALIFPSPSRYWRPMVRFPATTSIVVLSPVSLAWTVRCFLSRARWRFSCWLATWGCLLSLEDQTSMCHSRAWIAALSTICLSLLTAWAMPHGTTWIPRVSRRPLSPSSTMQTCWGRKSLNAAWRLRRQENSACS